MSPLTSLRFLSVFVTLLMAPRAGAAGAPVTHQDAPTHEHESRAAQPSAWVNVMNPDGIHNGNGFFPFDATCLAAFPTAATVLGQVGGLTLYRLEAPGARPGTQGAFGTQCPPGTLLLMREGEWQALQDEGTRWHQGHRSLQDTIRALVAPPKEPRP